MNDVQKKIQEAYRMVSVIPVSGDAVDLMAGARIQLKAAFEAAGGMDAPEEKEAGGNG